MSDDMATTMERETLPRTGRPSPATPEPEAPAKPANGGRRRTVFLIMGVILLALIGIGVRRWIFGLSHVSTDNAQVDGHIIPILPKVGGFVTDVRVDDNRAVKVGDVLVVLDDRDYKVGLDQAEADLGVALAAVSNRARVGQAEAQVEQAQAMAQKAQAALVGADARVAAARAVRDQAALNLSYTRITAPSTGVVSKKNVEVGQLVQAGQPLMTVVPLDDIWVIANLKETETADVTPGDSAVVTVDAYKGTEFRGHVESLSPATGAKFSLLPPDNATGN